MMTSLSPEQRFAFYYAALFGSFGAVLPFVALWLEHGGVQASMIGTILAAPSVLMLFTTLKLGRWADSLKNRCSAIVAGNWVVLLVQLVLFFYTNSTVVLVVWTLSGIVLHAKIPATDAAALSLFETRNSDFAQVRMWGSVGFIVALYSAGMIYEHWGIASFVAILLFGNIVKLSFSYALPAIPRIERRLEDTAVPHRSLYKSGILLTIAGSALINASHSMFNSFGILNWTQHGMSESVASLAMCVGVVAEVFLMWRFSSLTRRVSARSCLLIAAGCGILRWSVLATNPILPVLLLVQLLHGVTFGVMYIASANFIAKRVPAQEGAAGQSLLATLTMVGMASGTFITGLFFEQFGGRIYWGMAGICAVAALVLLASLRYDFDGKEPGKF